MPIGFGGRVIFYLGIALVMGAAWQILGISDRPAAAGMPAEDGGTAPEKVGLFSLTDLRRLRLPAGIPVSVEVATGAPLGDTAAFWRGFQQISAEIDRSETGQRRIALEGWKRHLDDGVSKRLADARQVWEERIRDRMVESGIANDEILRAYAAALRREAYARTSSLEMQIAMAETAAARKQAEERLGLSIAEVDQKVAARGHELEEASLAELNDLRQQAEQDLAELEQDYRREAQAALADFQAKQEAGIPD